MVIQSENTSTFAVPKVPKAERNMSITLAPFTLPADRHYVRAGDDFVLKFCTEFRGPSGAPLPTQAK